MRDVNLETFPPDLVVLLFLRVSVTAYTKSYLAKSITFKIPVCTYAFCDGQCHKLSLIRIGPRGWCYTGVHLPSKFVILSCSGVCTIESVALSSYRRAALRTNTTLHGSSALRDMN